MAFSDEPTEAQMNFIYQLINWSMSGPEARFATKWLEGHSAKRDVSYEIKRLKALKDEHKLSRETIFENEIWDNCPVKLGKVN